MPGKRWVSFEIYAGLVCDPCRPGVLSCSVPRPPSWVLRFAFFAYFVFEVRFDMDKAAFLLMGGASGEGRKLRFPFFCWRRFFYGVFRETVEFVRGFAEIEDEVVLLLSCWVSRDIRGRFATAMGGGGASWLLVVAYVLRVFFRPQLVCDFRV